MAAMQIRCLSSALPAPSGSQANRGVVPSLANVVLPFPGFDLLAKNRKGHRRYVLKATAKASAGGDVIVKGSAGR